MHLNNHSTCCHRNDFEPIIIFPPYFMSHFIPLDSFILQFLIQAYIYFLLHLAKISSNCSLVYLSSSEYNLDSCSKI